MPRAAPKPCQKPGCGAVTDGRYCPAHASSERRSRERERGSAASRGYGRRWQRVRADYLQRHPLCAEHERQGRIVAATIVDHIVPHRGDPALFWDESNWQSLCKPCHDHKTATEDR